jgi:hypothetical protein
MSVHNGIETIKFKYIYMLIVPNTNILLLLIFYRYYLSSL